MKIRKGLLVKPQVETEHPYLYAYLDQRKGLFSEYTVASGEEWLATHHVSHSMCRGKSDILKQMTSSIHSCRLVFYEYNDERTIVGMLSVVYRSNDLSHPWYLQVIGVDDKVTRGGQLILLKGVGTSLLLTLIGFVQAISERDDSPVSSRIGLDSEPSVIGFYTKHGFCRVRPSVDDYVCMECDTRTMNKTLSYRVFVDKVYVEDGPSKMK